MSVYLQDDKVLLDGGSVATSEDCCCGGVCCFCDGTCEELTESECTDAGGTFNSGESTCDPNPCVPTGTCCTDGVCSDGVTQEDCENGGGTYLENCAECQTCTCGCDCGYAAFDGSGRRFLRYHRDVSGTWDVEEDCFPDFTHSSHATVSATYESHFEFSEGTCCNEIEDQNEASSDREDTNTGPPPEFDCHHPDSVDCFCNTIGPLPQGLCTSPFNYCLLVDCNDFTVDIDTTATTKTTTWDLMADCTVPPGDCECHRTGTYTVVETLSEECIPI